MILKDGEYLVKVNNINHWVKIEGAIHQTVPLVLLHGGPGGNHYTFERTIGPRLAENRTLVYYEQRGSGRSEKPISDDAYTIPELIDDFIQIKNWLQVDKVDLLGYSFGGELALEIAFAYPEAISRLVLSAPGLMYTKMDELHQIVGFMSVADHDLRQKIKERVAEGGSVPAIYNDVWNMVDTATVDKFLFQNQEVARHNRNLWDESGLTNTGLMNKVIKEKQMDPPLSERLKDISHPTLLLTGIHDRNTGLPIGRIIHRELPNCHWVLFMESAHFPDLEEPGKFKEEIDAFLLGK
jgi:proline iminopeptidase